jgi:hypothetical protein
MISLRASACKMSSCRDLELCMGWSATNAEGDWYLCSSVHNVKIHKLVLVSFLGKPLHNGKFELFALLMAVKVSCFLLLMYAGNRNKCLDWSHW